MKRFSGLLQFILGFFLGITILVGLTSALGYLMFSRLAATPSKPVFSEENKSKPKSLLGLLVVVIIWVLMIWMVYQLI
jgi:hypothetical protein